MEVSEIGVSGVHLGIGIFAPKMRRSWLTVSPTTKKEVWCFVKSFGLWKEHGKNHTRCSVELSWFVYWGSQKTPNPEWDSEQDKARKLVQAVTYEALLLGFYKPIDPLVLSFYRSLIRESAVTLRFGSKARIYSANNSSFLTSRSWAWQRNGIPNQKMSDAHANLSFLLLVGCYVLHQTIKLNVAFHIPSLRKRGIDNTGTT